jgi:hypothetical protein
MKFVSTVSNLFHDALCGSSERSVTTKDNVNGYTKTPHIAFNIIAPAYQKDLRSDVALSTTLCSQRIWEQHFLRVSEIADFDNQCTLSLDDQGIEVSKSTSMKSLRLARALPYVPPVAGFLALGFDQQFFAHGNI